MSKSSSNGGSGQARTDFFQQIVASANPLNPRELIIQVIPGTGIPMRDYFAVRAMAGLLEHVCNGNQGLSFSDIAERSYVLADIMLKARQEKTSEAKGFPYTDGDL